MITKRLNGIHYDMGKDSTNDERDLMVHIALTYEFLLNTPEHLEKDHSWSQLANLMDSYYDNSKVKLFADFLREIDRKYFNQVQSTIFCQNCST